MLHGKAPRVQTDTRGVMAGWPGSDWMAIPARGWGVNPGHGTLRREDLAQGRRCGARVFAADWGVRTAPAVTHPLALTIRFPAMSGTPSILVVRFTPS